MIFQCVLKQIAITDTEPLLGKYWLWKACLICLRGTFVAAKEEIEFIPEKFQEIWIKLQKNISVAEAILSLQRYGDNQYFPSD